MYSNSRMRDGGTHRPDMNNVDQLCCGPQHFGFMATILNVVAATCSGEQDQRVLGRGCLRFAVPKIKYCGETKYREPGIARKTWDVVVVTVAYTAGVFRKHTRNAIAVNYILGVQSTAWASVTVSYVCNKDDDGHDAIADDDVSQTGACVSAVFHIRSFTLPCVACM